MIGGYLSAMSIKDRRAQSREAKQSLAQAGALPLPTARLAVRLPDLQRIRNRRRRAAYGRLLTDKKVPRLSTHHSRSPISKQMYVPPARGGADIPLGEGIAKPMATVLRRLPLMYTTEPQAFGLRD
jgi:hypothetical protein